MEEDGTFLVIVGDSEDKSQLQSIVTIKPELVEKPELETIIVEIAETPVKEEHKIEVKLEPVYNEYEYLEDEVQIENTQTCKSPQLNTSDEEYIPEGYAACSKSVNSTNYSHRRKMLDPKYQKSFVAELRDKYPELAEDEDLLVQTLGEIMRNIKAPTPPKGSTKSYIKNNKTYECLHCGAYSETAPAANRHYNEKHGPRYLVCFACGVDFRSTTNLYKHEKRCSAVDAGVVLRARAWRLGPKGRGRPRDPRQPPPPPPPPRPPVRYSCNQCSASFVTKMTLRAHQNLHDGVKPYQCHACPAAYTSYSVLSRHEKKHSMERFICDVCARAFAVKAALVTHMDTHRPLRKYACERCERRFAQRAALKLHVDRVHKQLPQPFACDVCDKRCARMSLLKQHMQKEHGLLIMTRKMFFRKLPNMSEEEMKRAVKVVLKSRVDDDNNVQMEDNGEYEITNIDGTVLERNTYRDDNNKALEKETVRKKGKMNALKKNKEKIRFEEIYMEEDENQEMLPESSSMKEFIDYLKLEDKIGDKCVNVLVVEDGKK